MAALALGLAVAMAAAWTIARVPGRSGWTDAIWSFAIGVASVVAALAPPGGGTAERRRLAAALVAAWSLRLGLHIARRAAKGVDDPRYKQLREEWGDRADARLFGFLQIQAACAWVLAATVLVAARNPARFPTWSDAAGVAIVAVAILGETLADRQLRRFGQDEANKGKVCDVGLWSLSRHPNYFFEFLGWCAWPVIAIGPAAGWGWGVAALAGPALMYALLVHASGIPPLEAHMMRSRPEAFADYRRRVRAFWPIPKRVAQ